MKTYPKINSLWKRDDKGRIIEGDYSLPEFGYLADLDWCWSEKIDGTNARLGWPGSTRTMTDGRKEWLVPAVFRGKEHAHVAGRSDNAQMPPHLMKRLVELLQTMPIEEVFPDSDATLYGEGYGAKIQKGGQYLPDRCDFILFDVMVGGLWLKREDVEDVGARLGLDVVPIVATCSIPDAVRLVKDGFKSQWPNAAPEGLVGRPAVDLCGRRGERIVTKIKAKDFQ